MRHPIRLDVNACEEASYSTNGFSLLLHIQKSRKKKIKKLNNIVTAEYYPEGEKQDVGKITYDIAKREVIDKTYCAIDEASFLQSYFHKAVIGIEKCVIKGEYPETLRVMWY